MDFVVKNTTSMGVLDLIAPFTCRGCGRRGDILCDRCKKYNIRPISKICPRCGKNHKTCSCEAPVYAVGEREGVLKQIVEEYKFQSIRATARVLVELIDSALPVDFPSRNVVVVPLPTIPRHIRERGFDHTRLIAKQLVQLRKKKSQSWTVLSLLVRKNNTVQVGANRKRRLAQARQAYEVSQRKLSRHPVSDDTLYLLLDDIWTTGASMEAAIRELKQVGVKNIAGAVLLVGK